MRVLHWGLAIIVLLNLFWFEEGDEVHRWVGYAAVGIVVARMLLGFWGLPHERFGGFPLGFQSLKKFILGVFRGSKAESFSGHNPLASWIYILMWLAVIALGVTGWMMGLDRFFGDDLLNEIHAKISDFMIALIVLHMVGMLFDSFRYRRHTWLSMFTGRR